MNNIERITVAAGGMIYQGFEDVKVTAAINEAARQFSMSTTESPGEFRFPPGTPIDILANGDLVVRGYVNQYAPSGDAKSHKISISGRGKGQDFVDCCPEHQTGTWENKKPDEIAQEIDQWGVGINARVPLEPEEYWKREPGETSFRTTERLLRSHGVTMMGKADGSIDITNASAATRHAGALIEGVSILKYQGQLSDQDRYGETKVKGQARLGKTAQDLRINERARDGAARAGRRKELIDERATSPKRARERAEHESERAAGLSIKATITVQGWRDDGGTLWEPNGLIFIESPILLHLVQDMLIEKVQFEQGPGGATSVLSLVDPRTYKGKQGSKTNSDKAWGYM